MNIILKPNNSKNLTRFSEKSPNFVTNYYQTRSKNRPITDNNLVVEPSTFTQELDNILRSYSVNLSESSWDEFVLSADDSNDDDDDRSSSGSESEICIGYVQRKY